MTVSAKYAYFIDMKFPETPTTEHTNESVINENVEASPKDHI